MHGFKKKKNWTENNKCKLCLWLQRSGCELIGGKRHPQMKVDFEQFCSPGGPLLNEAKL